jgi:hypothetical protein
MADSILSINELVGLVYFIITLLPALIVLLIVLIYIIKYIIRIIACKKGHDWDGCVCKRKGCGARRDIEHDWKGCRCEKCHKERDIEHHFSYGCYCINCHKICHDWDGCVCKRCGETRDIEHDWDGCVCKRKRCGKTRDMGHDWDGWVCKRCHKTDYSLLLNLLSENGRNCLSSIQNFIRRERIIDVKEVVETETILIGIEGYYIGTLKEIWETRSHVVTPEKSHYENRTDINKISEIFFTINDDKDKLWILQWLYLFEETVFYSLRKILNDNAECQSLIFNDWHTDWYSMW